MLAFLVPPALAACASLDAASGGAAPFDPTPARSTVEPARAAAPEPPPDAKTVASVEAIAGELAPEPGAEAPPGPEPHPVTAWNPQSGRQAPGVTIEHCGPTEIPSPDAAPQSVDALAPPAPPGPPAPSASTPALAPPASDEHAASIAASGAEGPTGSADLWQRLRRGFALPDLAGHRVRASERGYAARPDAVQRMMGRASRYLFHIVQEVERRGLPTELALLPFIESAFNPEALSSARASGIWQFIPSTGRHFDLEQNIFRDDRRDVLASTRAALDYLETLHRMFGDWHIALAAYNWGEGNVARAIARNRKARKPTDYSSLGMPRETQSYVPRLQAVKNIVARPEAFGLVLPGLVDHPYFLSVPIESDIDVGLAANLAGLSIEDFRALNPQMNKPVILAAGTPQVLLPYDSAHRFARNLVLHAGPLASWTAWVATRTLNPAKAAQHVGMSEADLRKVNAIPQRMLIQAGSTLLVPRPDNHDADISEHLADTGRLVLVPDRVRIHRLSVTAGRRDSVASLALRHGVAPDQLARWNRVDTTKVFRPGQSIILYLTAQAAHPISESARNAAGQRYRAAQRAGARPSAVRPHRQ